MPENDLGTAHGNIRLDFDDRASAQSAAALAKIKAQMDVLQDRFSKAEKTIEDFNKELAKGSKEIDVTVKKTKDYDKSLLGLHKSTINLTRDTKELYSTIHKVSDAFDKVKAATSNYIIAGKVINAFQNNLKGASKELDSINGFFRINYLRTGLFVKSMKQVGLVSTETAKSLAAWKLGTGKAMKDMPRWTQDIHAFAGGLAKFGLAATIVGKTVESGKLNKYFNTFSNLGPIKNAITHSDRFAESLERVFRGLENGPIRFKNFASPFEGFGKDAQRFLGGIALVNSGIDDIIRRFAFLAKIPKPIWYALGVGISDILPAALKVGAKALTGMSDLVEGLWDGVKQLSGGLLVLPGVFATIGAAISPLAAVFGGLKDKFKDLFSDDYWKSIEALYALPENLRPLGAAVKEASDKFKELQKGLQAVAFKGIEEQIRSLTDTYFPLFDTGSRQVILSFRQMKDELVKFALAGQTQKDFSSIYANTATALLGIGRAIRPAADGFRDIAVVGNEWIADMSSGLSRITEKFAAWAQVNRNNGRIYDWIDNARHGFVELYKGTVQLTEGAFKLFTVFKTQSGDNFLDRYAAAMTRFNEAVRRSEAVGVLGQIGDAVRSLAGRDIDNFKEIWKDVGQFVGRVTPVINSVANAFQGPFLFALESALHEFGLIAEAIHSMGLDSMLGTILGVAAGWSAFSNLMVPVVTKLKVFIGLWLSLSTVSGLIKGIDGTVGSFAAGLEKLGSKGSKAATVVTNIGETLVSLAPKLLNAGGIIAAVAVAALAVYTVWSGGTEELKKFSDAVDNANKDTTKFAESLSQAFTKDRAAVGNNVLSSLSEGLNTLESDLKRTSDNAPGALAKLKDGFSPKNLLDPSLLFGITGKAITDLLQPSEEIKKKIDTSKEAGRAAAGLEELRKRGIDLNKVLLQSDDGFKVWSDSLANGTQNEQAAGRELGKYHKITQDSLEAERQLGPAGEAAASAFDKIAHSAGDLATKLEGIKQFFRALGLLQIDADEAAANYAKTLDDMSDKIAQAIQEGDGLQNVFKDGHFNTADKTAQNLIPLFKDLSDKFLDAATSSGNLDENIKNMTDRLGGWAKQLGVSKEFLENFIATEAGFDKNPLKILVQLDKPGIDETTKQFGEVLAAMQAMAINHKPFINFKFNTDLEAQNFSKALNDAIGGTSFSAHGAVLELDTQLNQDQWDKFLAYMSAHGINTTGIGGPPPTGTSATLPVATVPAGPSVPAIPVPSGPPPKIDPSILDQPGLGGFSGFGGGNAGPVGQQGSSNDLFGAGNGPADSSGASAQLQGLNAAIGSITTNIQSALGAVNNFTDTLVAKFTDKDYLAKVEDSGTKFGEALAKGLTDGQGEAFRAAEQIAQGIRDRFHQSPPKKGPLSAHGDAAIYAGMQFVLAYARGVNSTAPRAAQAAGNVGAGVARSAAASALGNVGYAAAAAPPSTGGAGGVGFSSSGAIGGGIGGAGYGGAGFASALGGVAQGTPSYAAPGQGVYEAGKKFGARLSDLVQFIGHAVDAFSKVTQVGLQFGKFLSDPLGKGTFFGSSLGATFGYKPIPPVKPGQLTPRQKLDDRRLGLGLGATPSFAGANQYDPITGTIKPPPGQIGASSSKEDIQRAVASAGQAAGAGPEDIAAALSVIDREDPGYNPLAVGHNRGGYDSHGNPTDAIGLFQQSPYANPEIWGTPQELIGNPQRAIDNYWKQWAKVGPQGASPYWPKGDAAKRAFAVQGASGYNSQDVADQMKKNLETVKQLMTSGAGLTPTAPGALPGVGTAGGLLPQRQGLSIENVQGANTVPNLIPNAEQAARLAGLIFPDITRIGGIHPDALQWHPSGRGLDIWVPGEPQGLQDTPTTAAGAQRGQAIADYFLAHAEEFGIEGVIWNNQYHNGKTKAPGRDTQPGHGGHVHLSFLPQQPGTGPFTVPVQGQGQYPIGATGVVPTTSFGPPPLPSAAPPSAPPSLAQWNPATGKYEPIDNPVPGGPGSAGLPQSARLSQKIGADGGVDVTDQSTGKVIQHIPPGLVPGSAPVQIKDPTTGNILGQVYPGAKGNEPPFLAPPEPFGPNGEPWNDQTSKAFFDQHPFQIAFPGGTPAADISATPGLFPGGQIQTQQQLVAGLGPDTQTQYAQGMQGQNAAQNLQLLEIQKQQLLAQGTGDNANNPQAAYARAQAAQIDQYQQDIMQQNNLEEAQNPFQSGLDFLGQASGIAGDVINSIQAGIDAIGATKDITDLVSRGVSNTKQISSIIDDTQKYITFAADIAQTTGDVLTTIGSLAGAAGGSSGAPGGGAAGAALQAAGEVASLISAGLQAVNAVIDLGQEAAKTVGTFIAPKLESLVGGPGGGLTGDVKFLLDTQSNQLLAYSADNPQDKRAHTLAGQTADPNTRNQLIGNVNVYGGPGTDPRDDTRQMMYQVRASTLTAVTNG